MKRSKASAATLVLALAAGVAGAACKQQPAGEVADAGAAVAVVDAATVTSRADAADPEGYGAKVQAWNDALTRKDTSALAAMYAPKDVLFYGAHGLTREAVVKAKSGYLAKHPDFVQTVADVHVKQWRATFAKTVTEGGKTTTYAAYLAFENGLIAVEGDETTDKNREAAAAVKDGDRCGLAAAGLVTKQMHDAIATCQKWVDQSHDPSVHCGGMDEPPMPGQPAWTFEVHIDHPERIEPVAFISVDLTKRTVTEDGLVMEGEEKPFAVDPKAMDDAVATCAKYPPH